MSTHFILCVVFDKQVNKSLYLAPDCFTNTKAKRVDPHKSQKYDAVWALEAKHRTLDIGESTRRFKHVAKARS